MQFSAIFEFVIQFDWFLELKVILAELNGNKNSMKYWIGEHNIYFQSKWHIRWCHYVSDSLIMTVNVSSILYIIICTYAFSLSLAGLPEDRNCVLCPEDHNLNSASQPCIANHGFGCLSQ